MNVKECENCGSHSFHKNKNHMCCDYCQTIYIIKEKSEKNSYRQTYKSYKQKNVIFFSIIICLTLTLTLTVFLGFINKKSYVKNSRTNNTVSQLQKKLENTDGTEYSSQLYDISVLKSWTQPIYEDLTVATKNYDEESEKYEYVNGSNFEELIKKVGQPDSTSTSHDISYGMPVRVTATWNKDVRGGYASVTITITYIESNKMIIDKNLMDY